MIVSGTAVPRPSRANVMIPCKPDCFLPGLRRALPSYQLRFHSGLAIPNLAQGYASGCLEKREAFARHFVLIAAGDSAAHERPVLRPNGIVPAQALFPRPHRRERAFFGNACQNRPVTRLSGEIAHADKFRDRVRLEV